jgi:hypothetical protein
MAMLAARLPQMHSTDSRFELSSLSSLGELWSSSSSEREMVAHAADTSPMVLQSIEGNTSVMLPAAARQSGAISKQFGCLYGVWLCTTRCRQQISATSAKLHMQPCWGSDSRALQWATTARLASVAQGLVLRRCHAMPPAGMAWPISMGACVCTRLTARRGVLNAVLQLAATCMRAQDAVLKCYSWGRDGRSQGSQQCAA